MTSELNKLLICMLVYCSRKVGEDVENLRLLSRSKA